MALGDRAGQGVSAGTSARFYDCASRCSVFSAIARKFGIARSEERQSCCAYARTSLALEGIGVFLSFAACDHSGSSFGAYWENANGLLAVRVCCGSYLQ